MSNKELQAALKAKQEKVAALENQLAEMPVVDDTTAQIVNDLKGQVDVLQSENVELRTQLEKAGPAAPPAADPTVEARFAVLEEELQSAKTENAELSLEVSKLSKVAEKESPSKLLNLDPVKVGKDFYKFAMPAVYFQGKRITADDVRESDDLILSLIEAGSGMLVKQ